MSRKKSKKPSQSLVVVLLPIDEFPYVEGMLVQEEPYNVYINSRYQRCHPVRVYRTRGEMAAGHLLCEKLTQLGVEYQTALARLKARYRARLRALDDRPKSERAGQ